MQIAFKVDVDTKRGLEAGVPNLLKIFREYGIRASFFIPMGPDRMGMAIRRLFRTPRILEKVKRTNALKIYGLRTLLYGTLLPAPSIVAGNERLMLDIRDEGHEIGIHSYDHLRWQDHMDGLNEDEITAELEKADSIYKGIFGDLPRSFAAPGWRYSRSACMAIDKRTYLYTSNTRGEDIYFPVFGDLESETLEIPTTLPTLDELRIPLTRTLEDDLLDAYIAALRDRYLNVYTLHAEIEGISCGGFLNKFIQFLRKEGALFLRLEDMAELAIRNREAVARANVADGLVSGRAGVVARQAAS